MSLTSRAGSHSEASESCPTDKDRPRGEQMRAMVLTAPRTPLQLREVPVPRPGTGQVLIRVSACGVCRTDLHLVDGELPEGPLPIIPGHQIVGQVIETGPGVDHLRLGDRVGVPWLGSTCGSCRYCRIDRENLCDNAGFTGYTIDGGFAELTVADQRYCFDLPDRFTDLEAAPLLCAGLIGYRSYRMCQRHPGRSDHADELARLGIYGFGAAAHIIAQIAVYQGRQVYAFTRPGDDEAQRFAREVGACWAGGSDEAPPEPLDAAIIFAPVGALVPAALRAVRKAGIVSCGGIHMSDIPSFPYSILWEERELRSVANLERRDGVELLALAAEAGVRPHVEELALDEANETLRRLREGRLTGAAVLKPSPVARR